MPQEDSWGTSIAAGSQTDFAKIEDGASQVPDGQIMSSPPEPRWELDVSFRLRDPSVYQGAIASYGSPEFLAANVSDAPFGGWALYYASGHTLELWTGGETYQTNLKPAANNSVYYTVSIQADVSKNMIMFQALFDDGTCALLSPDAEVCSQVFDGRLDFDDFKNSDPNFKFVYGGRGYSNAELDPEKSTQAFAGQIKRIKQTIQAGAEYELIFIFLFLGTLCYCALWAVGQWIVASKGAELNAEVKAGEAEQAAFVQHQLSRTPAAQRHEWAQSIQRWQECQKGYKKVFEKNDVDKLLRKYGLRGFFMMLVVLDMFIVMWLAAPGGKGFISSASFGTAFLKAWNFSAAPIGWIFLGSSILETTLFAVGCCFVVWPQNREQHATTAQHPAFAESSDSRRVTSMGARTNNTCLLIACHNSALDDGMRTDLERTLNAALENFPPECIFVCDNGRGLHPSDDTQGLCNRVSDRWFPGEDRRMNYVFIPEGNKTHALYWVSEWWIPFLVHNHKVPDFEYLVMIDDDVPLPRNFDFHAAQMEGDHTTAAVGYAITAVTPTDPTTGKSEPNFLVDMQDVEYRISGFFKLVQAELGGSSFYAHGAVSLWRRKILGKEILYKHDTEFHGEDLYMGLLLHRQEGQKNRIQFSASNVVETFAPDHFKLLFKQRTKSWDLATHRKFVSILRELLFRWKDQFLFLKLFHLNEVIAVLQDWLRLYLLILLLLTNPVALAGITCFFMAIAYSQLIFFRFVVLRNRQDLKDKLGPVSLLAFPIYKTVSTFLFRQYAMMENAFYYSTNFKKHTVEARMTWPRDPTLRDKAFQELGPDRAQALVEGTSSTFPPRPVEVDPDWWHVWRPVDDQQERAADFDTRVDRQSQQLGCLAVAPACVVERVRQLTTGYPPALRTTSADNQGRLQHLMLAQITLLRLGVESGVSHFDDAHMAASSVTLLRQSVFAEIIGRIKIAATNDLLKTDPHVYDEKLNECAEIWQNSINQSMAQGIVKGDSNYARYLFMTAQIQHMSPQYMVNGMSRSWEQDLVEGTCFAFTSVLEELEKMRIPNAHDVFELSKKKIHDAIRELKTGRALRP